MTKIKYIKVVGSEPNQCFKNSLTCSYEFNKNSQYVEGFIIKDKVFFEHSWIEVNGEIIEITPNVSESNYYPYYKGDLKEVRDKSFRNDTPPPMFMYDNNIRRERKKCFNKLIKNGLKYVGDNNEINYTKYHKLKYFKINVENKTLVIGKKEFSIKVLPSLEINSNEIEDIIDLIEENEKRVLKYYLNITSSKLKKKRFNVWGQFHITIDLEKNEISFDENIKRDIKINIDKKNKVNFKNKSFIQIGFIEDVVIMVSDNHYSLNKDDKSDLEDDINNVIEELAGDYMLLELVLLNEEFGISFIDYDDFSANVWFDSERLFIDFINFKSN